MSNSKQIIESLVNDDLYQTKKLIKEDLVKKMGNALEEKLVEYAPTIFNEGKKGSKPDFLDLDKDGNKKEPMKKAAREKNESFDQFEEELKSLVEEIESETGEELSEEEILDLANELFEVFSEENEEDQEDEEEDEDDDESENRPAFKRTIGGTEY